VQVSSLTRHRAASRLASRCFALLAISIAVLVAACGSSGSGGPGASSPAPSGRPSGAKPACTTTTAPDSVPGWSATAKTSGIIPVVISTEQYCGANRLLFSFTTIATDSAGHQTQVPVGAPDRTASIALYELGKDPAAPIATATGSFLWLIEGTSGIYIANLSYPDAGDYGVEFTTAKTGGAPETIRVRYQVQPRSVMPAVGDHAPAVKTPTLADVGGDVRKVSTDPSPNPAFYQISEDQAIAQHKPFVLIFATPAFCTSRICGPTLDKVKAVAAEQPAVTFINVEPYRMTFANNQLQPVLDANNQLQTNDASDVFNLLSEPWIFVIDGDGIIRGSFEAIAGPDELKAAIAAATKG
jgi:hypothetical protein